MAKAMVEVSLDYLETLIRADERISLLEKRVIDNYVDNDGNTTYYSSKEIASYLGFTLPIWFQKKDDDGKQEVDLGLAEKCFVDFVGSDAEDVEYLNFDEDLDDGYME